MLTFLLQATPVPSGTASDTTSGGRWNNLDSADWIAFAALGVSLLTALGTFLWNWKVHWDQTAWQTKQENQRQTERAEDLARLAEDAKIKLEPELDHTHYFVQGFGPGVLEVAALTIAVKNRGKLEARLTRGKLMLPNGQEAVIQPMVVGIEDEVPSFPHSLLPNRSAIINASMLELVEALKRLGLVDSIEITAVVDDALGTSFTSNAYTLGLSRDW